MVHVPEIVRYDTVIRLTQYRLSDSAPAERAIAGFISAWKAAFGGSLSRGILHRELCRQVPEWTALAAKEVDNPIEAHFIEYLVAEPELDLSTIPALPPATEGWNITQDLHTVAFRLTKDQAQQAVGALMFNLFEVDGPPGMEQGFLMDWPPRGAFKMKEDALISSMLHQRMLSGASVKAFNRAEVTSAAGYAEGIDRFEVAFPKGRAQGCRRSTQGRREAADPQPLGSLRDRRQRVETHASNATGDGRRGSGRLRGPRGTPASHRGKARARSGPDPCQGPRQCGESA
jgi:hypothetical protein